MKENSSWILELLRSSDFWAALIGAIVGGLIAFGIQIVSLNAAKKQREDDALERKKGLAHSLLFKVIQVYSHLHHFHSHIEEQVVKAGQEGFQGKLWQIVMPLGNGPAEVTFTADEMALLLSLKNDDVFNNVVSSDEVHNSTISAFQMYHRLRDSLLSQMPAQMEGSKGVSELTREQMLYLAPKMVELEGLINSIRDRCAKDVEAAWLNVSEVQALFKQTLGLSYAIQKK